MQDIAIRKLFTLLSACVKNHTPMIQILKEKMILSADYQLLSSLEQFDFLTDQGKDLVKRIRDLRIIQQDSLANTYNLINNLTSLASEFKDVLNESRLNAEEPINRPHREAHILEKGYLQIRLDYDKRALETSEVYRLWQDRNNYFYENEAAYELKEEMDSFQCGTETLAEIRRSYVALEVFQNRFQQNRSWIISRQEYEQREKALIEEKKRRRKEWISENYPLGLEVLALIITVGVIISAGVEKGFVGVLVAISGDIVGGFVIWVLASVLFFILSLFMGEDTSAKALAVVFSILVILYQYLILGSVFNWPGFIPLY